MTEQSKGSGSGSGSGSGGRGLGKTLGQLQAEAMASSMFSDMMSSAGVGAHRMGLELYYMMPKAFIDAYEEVFIRAFGGKDDGGVNARGQSQAESGVLMKGKTAVRGSAGKKFKRHWTIADETAVELKDRIDKRLRGLARDIRMELETAEGEEGSLSGGGGGAGSRQCAGCGRLLSSSWKFCPFDGSSVAA